MITHAPETEFAKELWRWNHTVNESNPVDPKIKGMRPSSPQEFPKMLYKAVVADGGPKISETHIVANEMEQRNLESRGFHVTQEDAVAAVRHDQQEVARLAAERNYTERRMSPQAQAEATRANEEADGHLASVPETPIRRSRGRPKKSE